MSRVTVATGQAEGSAPEWVFRNRQIVNSLLTASDIDGTVFIRDPRMGLRLFPFSVSTRESIL